MPFACTACAQINDFTAYVKSRRDTPTPQRCIRCGCVHSVLNLRAERISPPMLPIDTSPRHSPWQAAAYRPLVEGDYELMFHHTGDRIFRLRWCGNGFFYINDKINMRQLLKWRGCWGDSL